MLVKTKMGVSSIEGAGIFATEFIPKGTKIWELSFPDIELTVAQVNALPDIARESFKHYAYFSKTKGTYILCFDDARFFNHSDDPNTKSIDSSDGQINADIAARDIQPGEELTTDYHVFDRDFAYKMSS